MLEERIESDLVVPGQEAEEREPVSVEEDLEIEVVNDTPPEDRRPPRNETSDSQTPSNEDEELKNYSQSVQKRIKLLRYEFHEERRQRERAVRERQEALTYASSLQQQIEQYRKNSEESQRALIQTSAKQKGSELDSAKRLLKEAYEAGDTDKMAAAQEAIAVLANEKRLLESYTPPSTSSVSYLQPQETQPVADQPAQPRVSAKAVLWKEANPWFGSDMALTGHAIDVHSKLVNAGVDPESDQYYEAIDKAVYQFQQNISGTQATSQAPAPVQSKPKNGVVISSSRTPNGQTRTKVQLTESALAVAKRLGVTPQQYAKELLKQQKELQ